MRVGTIQRRWTPEEGRNKAVGVGEEWCAVVVAVVEVVVVLGLDVF